MRCSNVRSKIDEYLDNGLTVKERSKIERHISECHECRTYIEITKEIIKTAPTLFVTECKPNWESLSVNIKEIFAGKRTNQRKWLNMRIPGFGTIVFPDKLTPIYSAVSAVIIFGLFISLFIFLMSFSDFNASKEDRFLMSQIEAAENIFKANIKILKEELMSVESSLPDDALEAIVQANRDVEKEINRCSRLAQIYPAERVIMEKLFESYRMQIKLHTDLLKNIKSQEA